MNADAAPILDVTSWLFVGAALLVALALVGLVARAWDLKRERGDRALALEARIREALICDAAVRTGSITARTHAPLRPRSPVTIELRGEVSTAELRKAAVAVAIREGFQSGLSFRLEDQIDVAQPLPRAA